MRTHNNALGVDFSAFLEYDQCSDFTLHEVGCYQCNPCYSYGPSIRPRTIIHYVNSGKGILRLNDTRYEIKSQQVFIIPPGANAYYEADAKDPWSYSWMHISGHLLNEVFYQAGLDESNPVFTPISPDKHLEQAFNDLLINYEFPYIAISKVYEFFHYLISNSSNKNEIKVDAQISYVKKTIRFIQNKYSLNIKVTNIANALGVNRSYLSRLFKEATGTSIQDYLLSYRMKIATDLLKNHNKSVSYTAFAVGYNDAFTFSKAYKRYTGINPSDVSNNA